MARLRDWPPLSELPRAEVDSLPLPARYSDLGWLCVPAAKQGTLISVTAVIRLEAVSETSDSNVVFLFYFCFVFVFVFVLFVCLFFESPERS